MSAAPEVRFAVVREDPAIEIQCARVFHARKALVCCSGGCTALALKHALPACEVTAYDINPAQIQQLHARAEAIACGDLDALQTLSQQGEFEKLFRQLRAAFCEFVAPDAALARYFDPATPVSEAHLLAREWTSARYWPALFDMHFCDALLVAMFGPDAVQHAAPGSYPRYFRAAFERGLLRPDGPRNPFLQHVFRSRWLDPPPFATAGRALGVETWLGALPSHPSLDRFDLVHLSNIFDWSSDALVSAWAVALRALSPGAVITVRQLNNDRALKGFFEPYFRFDDALGAALHADDRSLFYNRVQVGVRV